MFRQSLSRQRGLTLVSWMLVIGIALFFFMIGMKMVPTYLENYSIKQVLTSVSQDRALRDKSRRELKSIILKRFKINSVYDFRADDLVIKKIEGGAWEISTAYEVRKPVAGNVSIVMAFDEKVTMRR